MADLEYIDMIGVDTDTEEDNTEVESNSEEEQSEEDFVQDSEYADSEKEEDSKDTDPSEMDEIKKQIEVLEKRNKDKDDFINELREQVKAKESMEKEADTQEEELDYWDDPEAYNKKILDKLEAQEQKIRVQDVQIKEAYYAQTVEGYFNIVNQDTLREAVGTDPEFAEEFNKSSEPYKTAYEYLVNKTKTKEDSYNAEVERRVQERLKKAGIREPKKVPPNINNTGSSNSNVSTDEGVSGFEEFFGN